MASLLEEKREAETHAAEAERLLGEARAAASRAEGKVAVLEAELRDAASQHVVDSIAAALEKGTVAEEAREEGRQVRWLAVPKRMKRSSGTALSTCWRWC